MKFDQSIHDPFIVAEMIYDTDPQINQIIFGTRKIGISQIMKLVTSKDTFYATPYLHIIENNKTIAGIVSSYPIKDKAKLTYAVGKAYFHLFGGKEFIRKMPYLLKLNRLFNGKTDHNGYYIVYLFVQENQRRQGLAAQAIYELSEMWPTIYLHVAKENKSAIMFYENNSFTKIRESKVAFENEDVEAYLMRRISKK
ncbi:MAG: GNAT family N-acetyltransferase [Candidatus Izemoplasmatales bacterium]|nr:GNAT family N-acetyltransferase [Candidatus Izemoplasmatales bacterium]